MIDVDALYREYAERLFVFLVRTVPGGDRELAADLTSLTFLRVVQVAPRYEERGHPFTWLCQIAKFALIDHLRHIGLATRGDRPGNATMEPLTEDVDWHRATVDAGGDRHIDLMDVTDALQLLPDEQRGVIDTLFIEERGGVNAQQRLGLPKGVMYRRRDWAFSTMREYLEMPA